MSSNSSIVPLRQRETIDDPLTTILRSGARRLLAQEPDVALIDEADSVLVDEALRAARPGRHHAPGDSPVGDHPTGWRPDVGPERGHVFRHRRRPAQRAFSPMPAPASSRLRSAASTCTRKSTWEAP